MSTFLGFLDEIDHISIDRFTIENFRSKVFFLSHCHTDHMVGLHEICPENELPGPLYLSETSMVIVKRRFPAIKHLNPLKVGESVPISFSVNTQESDDMKVMTLTVTAIPAGHCPGSVMFLFEQDDKKILYTGDFRLCYNDIKNISALQKFQHKQIALDCLYLDSTFLSQNYLEFPTQKESIDSIIMLTDRWLKTHDKNIVVIRPPANYGYEHVLVQISQHFEQKTHSCGIASEDYLFVPEFDAHIDSNQHLCGRIHLCPPGKSKNWFSKEIACLPDLDEKHVCIIRPTAMKWTNFQKFDQNYAPHEAIENVYFVCYSNHSSYSEIKDVIHYLKPNAVKLNVLPSDIGERNRMYSCLDEITKDIGSKQSITSSGSENAISNKLVCNFQKLLDTYQSTKIEFDDEIPTIQIKRRKAQ